MNKEIIKGNWNQMKGKIKAQWGKLTDDEITQVNGNYEQLVGMLQKKYGYQKDEVETQVDKFIKNNKWQ